MSVYYGPHCFHAQVSHNCLFPMCTSPQKMKLQHYRGEALSSYNTTAQSWQFALLFIQTLTLWIMRFLTLSLPCFFMSISGGNGSSLVLFNFNRNKYAILSIYIFFNLVHELNFYRVGLHNKSTLITKVLMKEE